MTEGASKLLRDLALLLRRYRPEEFEELAGLLGRPEFTTALTGLLVELAAAGRRSPHLPGRSNLLEAVRATDESKYSLLRDAQEKLLDRGLHRSLADLVHAVESSGVPLPKKSYRRREDVVRAFIRAASSMSTDELGPALIKLGVAKATSDLRSWSDIILPKRDIPEGEH
jgi:hypothetical protein